MLRRYTLGTLMALLGLLALAGCAGLGLDTLERLAPPGTFVTGGSSPFTGKWTQSSMSVNGQSTVCPGTVTVNGNLASCDAIQRTYVADGTFLDSAPTADIGSGTWSLDPTGTYLTTIKNDDTETGSALINSTEYEFTVQNTVSGVVYTIVYTWTKD